MLGVGLNQHLTALIVAPVDFGGLLRGAPCFPCIGADRLFLSRNISLLGFVFRFGQICHPLSSKECKPLLHKHLIALGGICYNSLESLYHTTRVGLPERGTRI